jgi:hypothetical protein
VQPAQLSAGFDTEFLDQDVAGPAVRRKRVCLSLGAVQRQHKQVPQALSQGMLVDQGLELGDAFAGPAQIKVGGDPILERDEPQFLEPS